VITAITRSGLSGIVLSYLGTPPAGQRPANPDVAAVDESRQFGQIQNRVAGPDARWIDAAVKLAQWVLATAGRLRKARVIATRHGP
jgi:hypothetical protein